MVVQILSDFKQTRNVGLYAATCVLFDMHGNVREWVYDWEKNYSIGSQTNPEGLLLARSDREGWLNNYVNGLRSASRLAFGTLALLTMRFQLFSSHQQIRRIPNLLSRETL